MTYIKRTEHMMRSGYAGLVEQDMRDFQTRILRYVARIQQLEASLESKDIELAKRDEEKAVFEKEIEEQADTIEDFQHELSVTTDRYEDALALLGHDPYHQEYEGLHQSVRDLQEEIAKKDQKLYEQSLIIAGYQAQVEYLTQSDTCQAASNTFSDT